MVETRFALLTMRLFIFAVHILRSGRSPRLEG